MDEWHAFVDESGSFGPEDARPILAALVVRTADLDYLHAEIQRDIELALPHVQWPPHATFLNLPLFHILCRVASNQADADDLAVFQALKSLNALAARSVVEQVREGGRVNRDWLVSQTKLIRNTELSTVLARVQVRLTQADKEVRAILGGLGRVEGAFVAVSGETLDHECLNDARGRYFAVLEALVQRVRDVLRTQHGASRLSVSALELRVASSAGVRRLSTALLEEAVERVLNQRPGPVAVTVGSVRGFDSHTPGAFVLADFVGNRAGWVMRSGNPPLANVQRDIQSNTALAASSISPDRSHIAAAGTAEGAVAIMRSGEAVNWPLGARRWAIEQAEQWARIPQ